MVNARRDGEASDGRIAPLHRPLAGHYTGRPPGRRHDVPSQPVHGDARARRSAPPAPRRDPGGPGRPGLAGRRTGPRPAARAAAPRRGPRAAGRQRARPRAGWPIASGPRSSRSASPTAWRASSCRARRRSTSTWPTCARRPSTPTWPGGTSRSTRSPSTSPRCCGAPPAIQDPTGGLDDLAARRLRACRSTAFVGRSRARAPRAAAGPPARVRHRAGDRGPRAVGRAGPRVGRRRARPRRADPRPAPRRGARPPSARPTRGRCST